METILTVENGDTLGALRGFLKGLLQAGVVDALLVPMRTPRDTITPGLVVDPEHLASADPLAPVLPSNAATLAGKLSLREPRARVGAVLRACELRALVELVKMQQANLADMLLIAVDCAGTYDVTAFLHKQAEQAGDPLWQALYQAASSHPDSPDPDLRLACRMCEQPAYDQAQISIQLLDGDPDRGVRVRLPDELGERLGLEAAGAGQGEARLARLSAARAAQRDAEFATIRSRLEEGEGLQGVFAACIRCHNCMTVCPICYCKTCVFKSAIFDHEPMQFVEWARQKGAYRLPADTLLFHLTRMNHMALSCIGCGMCSQACPSELPVGLVFRAVGQRLQETFEYQPGRSSEEALPLVTFKADEWTEVGA